LEAIKTRGIVIEIKNQPIKIRWPKVGVHAIESQNGKTKLVL
jgi:hypothetical protein